MSCVNLDIGCTRFIHFTYLGGLYVIENIYYVDVECFKIGYFKGGADMTVLYRGQLFHHFNGFMLLGVI